MALYNELLWIFTQLPDDYLALDTETTGLPGNNGLPDIATLGTTVVRKREIAEAAIPWAQAISLQCSHRGPSLDMLTKALHVEDLRVKGGGIHGAKTDSRQTAQVVETLRQYGTS